MALGSPPQFNNYFLNPYLSGTFGYETYKPYDNLFLNSSLLTQDIASRKERGGPINDSIGQSILGGGAFDHLFGSGEGSTGPVFAPFGSPPPSALTSNPAPSSAPASGTEDIGSTLDQLISLLEGLKTSETAAVAEPEPVEIPDPPVVETSGDSSDLKNLLSSLLQILGGGAQQQAPPPSPMGSILGMNPFSGGFNNGSFGNPFSFAANPMSLFGGFGGNPAGSTLSGSNPLSSFSPDFGLFSNSPDQNPGHPALATLDPVIRSSLFSETAAPIFGNILANGGIPPFRSQFFI